MYNRKENMINDRGSTLVEIIVSLLVVGIIFTPLLMNLTTAFKANQEAEKELYAESVADNCLEITKAKGISGLENAAKIGGHTVDTEVTKKVSEGTAGYDPDDSSTYLNINAGGAITALGSSAYVSQVDGQNIFIIDGLKQGTETYYAKVEFDDQGDYSAINNPDNYSSIGGITGGRTALANLSQAVSEKELEALAQMANDYGGVTWYDKDNIRMFIKEKRASITIGHDDDTSSVNYGDYYVIARNEYIVANSLNMAMDSSSYTDDAVFMDNLGSNSVSWNGTSGYFLYTASEVASTKIVPGAPDTILLYYAPLFYSASNGVLQPVNDGTNVTYTLNSTSYIHAKPYEGIYIDYSGLDESLRPKDTNSVELPLKVYTIIGGTDIMKDDYASETPKSKLYIGTKNISSGTPNDIQVFSVYDLENTTVSEISAHNAGYADLDSMIGTANDGDYSKIYKVKVTVYDSMNQKKGEKESTVLD